MIRIYNRYIGNTGKYYRVGAAPEHTAPDENHRTPIQQRPSAPAREKPPALLGGGFSDLVSSFLPEGLDIGDIVLLLILFLLYVDSKDEEFLIILIVVGISMFKKD